MKTKLALALGFTAALATSASFAQTIKVAQVVELSGGGTAAGSQYRNGAKMAFAEINAAGGVMGKKIEVIELDTQSQPAIAKAMTVKAIDDKVVAIFGPVFSGSIVVSQAESQKAAIPNFTGGEAANVTAQGNPYIFRSSLNQLTAIPKVGAYMANELKAKSVAVVFVNNDFGKGGRDAAIKDLTARGVKVAADISTDPGQVDMSSAVLRAKQSNADALFAYLNEEESARLLKELRKQGYDKPLVGETTLLGAKVIELAGAAANGVRGHVGLTADAPMFKDFAAKYEKDYKAKSDHNGIKGYFSAYMLKAAIEKAKSTDGAAIAAVMKNACFKVKDHPGILMDVCYDDKGDIDRESFMVEVKDGKQVITATLPMVNKR